MHDPRKLLLRRQSYHWDCTGFFGPRSPLLRASRLGGMAPHLLRVLGGMVILIAANVGLRGLAASESNREPSDSELANIRNVKKRIHDDLTHISNKFGRPALLGLQECGSLYDFEPSPFFPKPVATDCHVDFGEIPPHSQHS